MPSADESSWSNWFQHLFNRQPKEDKASSTPEHSDGTPIIEKTRFKHIPEVHEEVRKGNLYYPLSGPPETPEEKELLRQVITQEKNAVYDALFHKMHRYRADLTRAAEQNCSDLQLDHNLCLRRKIGTFWDYIDFCARYEQRWQQCVKRNEELLNELGFSKAVGKRELARIVERADEIYLSESKEATRDLKEH